MDIGNFDFREEYYEDIHDMKPRWWMRWGALSAFIILIMIFFMGYLIEYPDVISSKIRFTTDKSSFVLPLEKGSQVEKILVQDNTSVMAGEFLLVLKDDSNFEDILMLNDKLNNFKFEQEYMVAFFNEFLKIDLQLGEYVGNSWMSFTSELLEYYKVIELKSYETQIKYIEDELVTQYELREQYIKLIKTDNEQKELLTRQFEVDSILYDDKIISQFEYRNISSNYLNEMKNLQQTILTLNRTDLEITKSVNTIKRLKCVQHEVLLEERLRIRKAFNKLRSSILNWERRYLLRSPINGMVSFLVNLKEESFYEGDIIVVTPDDNSFYATAEIPLIGAGKIQVGQRVILKLDDYPYREYGVLNGELSSFSLVSGENYYLGKIEIISRISTSHGKEVFVKENMRGVGEIVTNARNLLERIFGRLLYIFRK